MDTEQTQPTRDLDLVRRSLSDDAAAERELATRLECITPILAALNRRFSPPLPDADLADVAQDVTLLVWNRRDRYEGRAKLETWVYRFCLLELMNQRRKRGRRRTQVLREHAGKEEPSAFDGSDIERLESLLMELGPPEEDVIRMKTMSQMSFRQIADLMQIPGGTVKSHYYRGIEWLRSRINADQTSSET